MTSDLWLLSESLEHTFADVARSNELHVPVVNATFVTLKVGIICGIRWHSSLKLVLAGERLNFLSKNKPLIIYFATRHVFADLLIIFNICIAAARRMLAL